MIFSNDRTTNDALLNTLGDELAAAWVRFYAIEVDAAPVNLSTIGRSRQEAGGRGRPRRRGIRKTARGRLALLNPRNATLIGSEGGGHDNEA
jgi:hypothetical protein